ncbi:MAG: hypothetical protein HBSAPP03_19610 [Phycisphaerae bacterium]|nr:MAG: hypothetical protein HBSAPP03_19610 [Phycisphaerae bacterium]
MHVAVMASIVLHGVLLYAVASVTILAPTARPDRLTDAPATSLTLAPDAAPVPHAPPEPPPEAAPEVPVVPKATEPVPTPPPAPVAEIVLTSPAPTPPPASPPTPAPAVVPPPEPMPMPASFAGVQAERASRIVYVIDASAAMVPTFPFLKAELVHSLERLDPAQSFQIVAYRHRPPAGDRAGSAEVRRFDTNRAFAPATAASRRAAEQWLAALQPSGSSVPLTGLREALGLSPDLVFLLTSSIPRSAAEWGDGTAATLAALDSLNPINPHTRQRPAVIKAISFLHQDHTGLLAAIAREHGDGEGSYRVLGEIEHEPRR